MARGTGAFGKIPGMGDFLRLNLSAGFVQAWDTWLQAGLIAAQGRLGGRWSDCYLSAPIWRFSLPAGVAGSEAVSGVLMPSVDRVGRQYPLTLATPCDPGRTALRHFANDAWFAALEDVALLALDDDVTRDTLADRLDGLVSVRAAVADEGLDRLAGPTSPESVLAARMIEDRRGDTGIWTAKLEGEHRMFLARGLPDPLQIEGMFDLDAPVWRQQPAASPA